MRDINKVDVKGFYNIVTKEAFELTSYLKNKPKFTCYVVSDEDGNYNQASLRYVRLKVDTAEECGVDCTIKHMSPQRFITEMMLLHDRRNPVRAILQLPADKVCVEIFNKQVENGFIIDVDHLGDDVMHDMTDGCFDRIPATPRGIVAIVGERLGTVSGKKIAVIGSRSKTTGRYLPILFQNLNATVSMYHSRSIIKDGEFKDFDAVISCVGKPKMIEQRHLGGKKKLLVDVGVSVVDGKVIGDFSDDVRDDNFYTPWVGGVGLLTRAFLMHNVIDSYI